MSEMQLAFIIWIIVGLIFTIYGAIVMCSKKERPFGFWANSQMFAVTDTKAYNRATGKLFVGFGIVFCILGFPLLMGEESGLVMITSIGTMFASIVTMTIYVTIIEKKYRKK